METDIYTEIMNNIMADISELNHERQRLMHDFLQVKADLAKAREEVENLRKHNSQLATELEEREIAFQNIFSFIQESGQ